MIRSRAGQKGVSLMEALIALVVMAIGAVATLGMQSTLRGNADIAKQRSEATRLAQLKIESYRAYVSMNAVAGQMDWSDLISVDEPGLPGTSATFDRSTVVVDRGTADDDARSKTVQVTVNWTDRTGLAQNVTLQSVISGVPPELPGSLSVELDRSLLPTSQGRHASIPPDAVSMPDGTSIFAPPGGAGTQWIFDNTTGLIRNVCSPACPADGVLAQLVTGFVRFAYSAAPSSSAAENPADPPLSATVQVDQTAPTVRVVTCFSTVGSTYVQYFCAVPVEAADKAWSGSINLNDASIALSTSVSDVSASRYKVCRYTPVRGCHATVGSQIWGTPGFTASCSGSSPTPHRAMANSDHPRVHAGANAPMVNQNFLVIRAGDGSVSYQCPDDNPATPAVQGTTYGHQPAP